MLLDLSDLSIFSGTLSKFEVWLAVIILTLIVVFLYIWITDESVYNLDCEINTVLYEKLRQDIKDINAVALFDFMLDDGLLHMDDVQYLISHAEKPVIKLADGMVCE